MTNVFELHLRPELVQAVTEMGYTDPTPIQEGMIPLMLTGDDVIGQAQTGTGKTAAFALPMLHNLEEKQKHVQGLVLAPTRELAIQVAEATEQYGQHLGVKVMAVYGGQPYYKQIGRLKKGVDIVIGTPGRLLDLIKRKVLDLSNVSTVVLDEADEMLSMGFIEDIEAILEQTPPRRQTALFSATLPKEIRKLADQYMIDPESVTIAKKQLTVEAIEQRYYMVYEADKLAALVRLFEIEPMVNTLIFARTRVGTGDLANALTGRGVAAEALNGDMSQEARERVLKRFRGNQVTVLVATDVAARGLDIDDISHVINFDLPNDPEVFVHRVGRTGRAGRTGTAISLVTPRERWHLRKIERFTKQTMTQAKLPTTEEIEKHREAKLVERLMVWVKRARGRRERDIILGLVEEGHDPIIVAAAALKLARDEERQRPIPSVTEVVEEPPKRGKYDRKRGRYEKDRSSRERSGRGERGSRNGRSGGRGDGPSRSSHEEGMTRLVLDKGRTDGIQPNHIVNTLARHARISGRSIGKIRIQDTRTFVDVPDELVDHVLSKAGTYRFESEVLGVKRA